MLLAGVLALANTSGVNARVDHGAWAPAQPTQAGTPTAVPPACTFQVDKVAEPREVALGAPLTVTLSVRPTCSAGDTPLHVALVLDASSKPNHLASEMQSEAADLVDRLELSTHPFTKVGIVQFNAAADTLCALTNNAARAKSCIGRVDAVGSTRLDLGIQEGTNLLRTGRRDVADPERLREVMIFIVEGGNDAGCPPVLQAASTAKGLGVLMIGVCLATECDRTCVRQAATSARYFYEWSDVKLVARRREGGTNLPDRADLIITDTLPANMTYVAGSSEPAAVYTSPDLIWSFSDQPARAAYTMTFRVVPQEAGRHQTNVSAEGRFVRRIAGDAFSFLFPLPEIDVIAPATVTPTPPDTAPPTLTPTVPTPTATAVHDQLPAYLPRVLNR